MPKTRRRTKNKASANIKRRTKRRSPRRSSRRSSPVIRLNPNAKYKRRRKQKGGDIVGFIYNINEYNYSIKLKTLKDKKIPNVYNDGTICNNLSKKEIKTRFIENILSKETYEKLYKSKFYKTPSYCLIIEIFLRYLNIINYDNKVWFLNKSYTLFNNFIKID